MNRRRALQVTGLAATVGLAGCLDGVREHFQGELSRPIPVEVYNAGEQPYDVTIEAHDREAERQTYDEGYTIVPDERVSPPYLQGTDLLIRIVRYGNEEGDDLVEQTTVTPEARVVLIEFDDDDLDVEVVTDEADAEERETELADNETTTNASDG